MASPSHRGKLSNIELNRPKSAVDRALGKLKRLGLIDGVERRLNYTKSDTTLYSIIWQPFFKAFERVEAWKSERRNARNGDVTGGWSPRMGQGGPRNRARWSPQNGEHNSLTYLSNDNLYRSSYADPSNDSHENLSGVTQLHQESVERPKGFQEREPTLPSPLTTGNGGQTGIE